MSNSTYRPGDGLQNWATTLPIIVSPGEPVSGVGTPEGSFPAAVGKLYTDITTSDLYQKESGGTSANGWVLRGRALSSASGAAGSTGIPFLTIAQRNAFNPMAPYAACLLIDSDPPFQLSIWASGAWH